MRGLGCLINDLSEDGSTARAVQKAIGKTITYVVASDVNLVISFNDGSLWLSDHGQSCCEHRYMRTDDDPLRLVGQKLVGVSVKNVDNVPDECGDHEICFLEVQTDKDVISCAFHNEHSGYYGGFSIEATWHGEVVAGVGIEPTEPSL